jgi:hypothetical protein
MFKRFLILALVLGLTSVSFGGVVCPPAGDYTIMVVSDSGMERDGINDADNVTKANGGKFVDETLVYFLENLGYTVDTSGMGGRYRRVGKDDQYNEPKDWWDPDDQSGRKQKLLDACLIIVSRFAASSTYARTEAPGANTTVAWNTLSTPILTQNGPLIRGQGSPYGGSTKWGWNNGPTHVNWQGSFASEMAQLPKSHPAYSWVCRLNLFDYSNNPHGGAGLLDPLNKREPDLPIGDWPHSQGALVLGYLENDPSVWAQEDGGLYDDPSLYGSNEYQDHGILVYLPKGVDLDAFNSNGGAPGSEIYGVLGGDRGFLGIWSYDGQAGYYWGQDLTTDYKELFCRVIHDMIPEPATIALLGLGGLSLLRRRR